jgi:hypothetical protein
LVFGFALYGASDVPTLPASRNRKALINAAGIITVAKVESGTCASHGHNLIKDRKRCVDAAAHFFGYRCAKQTSLVSTKSWLIPPTFARGPCSTRLPHRRRHDLTSPTRREQVRCALRRESWPF